MLRLGRWIPNFRLRVSKQKGTVNTDASDPNAGAKHQKNRRRLNATLHQGAFTRVLNRQDHILDVA